MKKLWLHLLCIMFGCKFDFGPFGAWHSNRLYFCQRCGREQFDRTFEDIQPMNDEELEFFHREQEYEQERNRG